MRSAIIGSAMMILFAGTMAAQTEAAGVREPRALESACDGAWSEVRSAVASLRLLNTTATKEGQQRILCLLDVINNTRFDLRDANFDGYLATQWLRLLVLSQTPTSYEFFASQMATQPERIAAGLERVLLDVGAPEAFERYFASRRNMLAAHEEWNREGGKAAALFRPLLLRGKCVTGSCSPRISETVRIASENLDIIDFELQGAANMKAHGDSKEETEHVKQIQKEARALLEVVGRLSRGEATIGKER